MVTGAAFAIDGAASDPTAAAPATAEPRRNFLLFKSDIYFLQVFKIGLTHRLYGGQI
jgi:hypothetical protein